MAVSDHMPQLNAALLELGEGSGLDTSLALQILTDSVAEVIGLVEAAPFATLINASPTELPHLRQAAEEKFAAFSLQQKNAVRDVANTKAEIHRIEASFSFLRGG